jgi:hypothetical protein
MNADWWYAEPIDELIYAGFVDEGDFRKHSTNIGGASPKRILRSNHNGQLYIYKAESQSSIPEAYRPQADRMAATLASALLEPGEYIPVGLYSLAYDGKGPFVGSVQPLVPQDGEHVDYRPWSHGKPRPDDLKRFSDPDLARIQREQVLDWLIANHDSHGNQWIRVKGRLLGIDKTQACKHLGEDRLDADYHPNAIYHEDFPIYHYLFHAVRQTWRKLDPAVIAGVLGRAERLADADFLTHFSGYLGACPPNKAQRYPTILLERKHGLKKDFGDYYSRMLGREVCF